MAILNIIFLRFGAYKINKWVYKNAFLVLFLWKLDHYIVQTKNFCFNVQEEN